MRGWNRRNIRVTCSILAPGLRTPFAGNIIPSNMLDPAFTALVTNALYPQSIQTFPMVLDKPSTPPRKQFNSDQGDIKVDYNASNNDHIFARYSKGNQYDPANNSVALLGQHRK